MRCKILCGTALAGLLLFPLAVQITPVRAQAQGQHPNESAMSASGTVTTIATDKKSFAIQVNDNPAKTMQFVIDNNTQVQGRVSVGTKALVEYQPTNDGKNLALSVTPAQTQ